MKPFRVKARVGQWIEVLVMASDQAEAMEVARIVIEAMPGATNIMDLSMAEHAGDKPDKWRVQLWYLVSVEHDVVTRKTITVEVEAFTEHEAVYHAMGEGEKLVGKDFGKWWGDWEVKKL